MIPPCSAIRLRIACLQILTLLVMAPGELLAIQIAPNPNPDGNTITITPSAPGENLVPFTNRGLINVEAQASFQNSSQFNNGSPLPFAFGGAVVNSGTIINSDRFINNRRVAILEDSRFINLASGFYYNAASTLIDGTFVNKGTVDHNGVSSFAISQTGQYIQRQDPNSSVAPITVNRDQVFRNAGLVHIAAGEFSTRSFGGYVQTGTIQIDAVFRNGGRVFNDGQITVGSSGLYEHQNETAFPGPGPNPGGLTSNTGIFTNTGTTNIATGVFTNHGTVANSGTFSVGTAGQYSQTSSSASIAPTTVNTGNFGNRGTTNIDAGNFENGRIFSNTGMTRIGESATFRNTDTGLYNQPPGTTTKIDGSFINKFAMQSGGAITVSPTGSYTQVAGTSFGTGTGNGGTFTNAGQVHIGEGTTFNSFLIPDRPDPSGQYVQQASGTTRIDGVFDNRGSVKNEGAITVGATGQYLQSRGDTTALTGASTTNTGTFTSAGQVRIGEGTSFSNFPRLEHGAPPAVGGQYIQQAGGTTQIDGSFSNQGGRVTNEGTITVGATGTYNQTRSAAPVPATPATVNSGSFINAGTTAINAGTFTNQGSVVNSGTFQIGGNGVGTFANQGSVVNSGTFEVAVLGQVSGSGSYVQNAAAAQTIVNGTFAHHVTLQGGTLSGTGTIQGTVQNYGGLLLPGNNGLGTLTIRGQYAQGFGGTLGVNLAGLNSHGLLAVQGTGAAVTLNGFLTIGLLNGFSPSLGNTFGVLTCTGCTINGSLSGLSLPALASGLDWSVGFVNGLGLLQLAVVAGPTSSAPEPATLLLVSAGFIALLEWRRRQAKARSAQTILS